MKKNQKGQRSKGPSYRQVRAIETETVVRAFGKTGKLVTEQEPDKKYYRIADAKKGQKQKYCEVGSVGQNQAIRITYNFDTRAFSLIKSRFGRDNFSILDDEDFAKFEAIEFILRNPKVLSRKIGYINRFEKNLFHHLLTPHYLVRIVAKIKRDRKAYLISLHKRKRKP